MMRENIKVTQKQSDWLDRYKGDKEIDYAIDIQPHKLRPDSPIVDWEASKVARALHDGYEVKPEFKLNDFITYIRTRRTMKLDTEDRVDFINLYYYDRENVRLATKREAEHEKGRITDKKLDKLLLDLNSEERIRLYRKLDCRLDIEVE